MASIPQQIFCCKAAGPVAASNNTKLHNDPNRELHEAIFRSFLAFAVRRQDLAAFLEEEMKKAEQRRQESARLLALISGISEPDGVLSIPPPPTIALPPAPSTQQVAPAPIFTLEALKNNPITPQTPYIIHLTSRVNFGPVYSHRYFACPWNLQHDWIEVSLIHWFAAGEPFKLKAEKWDIRCEKDEHFFRLTLRPNLVMRPLAPTPVAGVHYAPNTEVKGSQGCRGD
jgi:hypothetical protein